MEHFYHIKEWPTWIRTRLGLQCQTPLRSYPLTLDCWPLLLSLSLLLWLFLLSQVKVKSTPSPRLKTGVWQNLFSWIKKNLYKVIKYSNGVCCFANYFLEYCLHVTMLFSIDFFNRKIYSRINVISDKRLWEKCPWDISRLRHPRNRYGKSSNHSSDKFC